MEEEQEEEDKEQMERSLLAKQRPTEVRKSSKNKWMAGQRTSRIEQEEENKEKKVETEE